MQEQKKENQYFLVAAKAYNYVSKNKMDFIDAWNKAATEIIDSLESRKKGCPRATFIGLCQSGNLAGIEKTKPSESVNYEYAKFAIKRWKENPQLTTASMWKLIRINFPHGAANHQGQLNVVKGLWPFFK